MVVAVETVCEMERLRRCVKYSGVDGMSVLKGSSPFLEASVSPVVLDLQEGGLSRTNLEEVKNSTQASLPP